jgi:secretion/DNA translocation related TadE-like protein
MIGPDPACGPRDEGLATVWAAAAVAVLVAALMIGLHLGAALTARHRAEAAADLSALAAAQLAAQGTASACDKATTIAAAMGAAVQRCLLADWDALVEVTVPVTMALPGADTATGRARAGPVTDTPAPEHAAAERAEAGATPPAGAANSEEHR